MTAVERFWALPDYGLGLWRSEKLSYGGHKWIADVFAPNLHVTGYGDTQEAACAEALEKLEKEKK